MQFTVSGLGDLPGGNERYSELVTVAALKHFEIKEPPRDGEGPAAYLVGGRLRLVYNELIVQFDPRESSARCREILEQNGFHEVEPKGPVESKWIVRHAQPAVAGESLLAAADRFKEFKEVQFAWPNSASEYKKANSRAPLPRDWWLKTIGIIDRNGNRVLGPGNPGVKIAVLDDGVDIGHPNLANRVAVGLGRNFAVAVNNPDHTNPMPHVKGPLGSPDEYSDYHGTSIAGIVCSDGSEATQPQFRGVAPGCRLVPVRVIDGQYLVLDQWVAKAINYATGVADVISCAWNGGDHADVKTALNKTVLGRGGKGVAVFGAAGNDQASVVDFPASHARVIAVGACTRTDTRPTYANIGDDLEIVAPSSGGGAAIYTTDVSGPGWGFNNLAGAAGDFYGSFGGTSAATAIAAAVGALCFSKNRNLTVDGLRTILQTQAVQIGLQNGIVYPMGHSKQFGYGRIDAAAAVAAA